MAKIANDKYYTPQHIVDLVIQRTKEVIGLENITEFIEPSAGNGAFLDKLYKTGIPTKAYDLYPERDDIIEQDYLSLDLDYKSGRAIIGNPPFGDKNNLAKRFCNISFEHSDYVVFILPISQLNNTQSIYKFDLIHSEDLGQKLYSDKIIHCCLNIYKRPEGGFNKKENYKNSVIEIIEIREVIKNNNPKRNRELGDFKYDLKILAWGTATGNRDIGCLLSDDENYAKTFYIKIKDRINYDKIYNIIKNAKWRQLYPMTATPNLLQWQVYKYLKEQIPEIQ